MRRINTTNKAVDLFGAGKHGWKNGVPGTADRPTEGQAEWFNSVQEELAQAIEAGGQPLNPASNNQLLSAIRALRGVVSVMDFDALGNGQDDTASIQSAIASVGAQDAFANTSRGIKIIFPAGRTYRVNGTLLLPSFVDLDLNGCTLIGNGANTMFASGRWNAGALVANAADPNDAYFVVCSSVRNGQIYNCATAFDLFNFCEGSVLDSIRFFGCNRALRARRCFYATFENLHSRSPLVPGSSSCYLFEDAVNAIKVHHVFAVGYAVGWRITGTKDNFMPLDCGAESCTTGVSIENSTSAIAFLGWYFEGGTTALAFSAGGNHQNVYVDYCWFNAYAKAIDGSTILSGKFGANNVLNGAAVNLPANFSNRLEVPIPTGVSADNTTPSLPSGYLLGDAVMAEQIKQIYNSVSGLVTNKLLVHSGVIPIVVGGSVGDPKGGTVPGCVVTLAGTTVTIDTQINFRNHEMVRYSLVVVDSGGSNMLAGDIVAVTVLPFAGLAAKAVTLTNNGGFIRLTVSGLVAAASCTGIVRHL